MLWQVANSLSLALEPSERDAVRGDLAESGASAVEAVCELFGLVARREARLWNHWRPWLALAMSVPLGLALNAVSRSVADECAIYAWLYANNWTPAYVTNPGARTDLLHFGSHFLVEFLALAAVSWLGGKLIAAVAGRSRFANGAVFCLALLVGAFAKSPHSLAFYAAVFPIIIQAVFVIYPSLSGLAHETQ